MTGAIVISPCDPFSSPALELSDALWTEIQCRYGFSAPTQPTRRRSRAQAAASGWPPTTPAQGSIALTPLHDGAGELDVMYVAPGHRGSGVARALLAVLEEHARSAGIAVLRLRAGEPQPEALRFYAAAGFVPIPPFGRWIGDGRKGVAGGKSKQVFEAERELSRQAEAAYARPVNDWQAAGPRRVGAGATPGRASQRPSKGKAARQAR